MLVLKSGARNIGSRFLQYNVWRRIFEFCFLWMYSAGFHKPTWQVFGLPGTTGQFGATWRDFESYRVTTSERPTYTHRNFVLVLNWRTVRSLRPITEVAVGRRGICCVSALRCQTMKLWSVEPILLWSFSVKTETQLNRTRFKRSMVQNYATKPIPNFHVLGSGRAKFSTLNY